MTEQHEAVRLILDRLKTQGMEWFRSTILDEDEFFRRPASDGYSIFDGRQIYEIGRKPKGSFPNRQILIMQPGARETEAVLGLWLRWNFEADPFEFRLFLGQWSTIDGEKSFVAFRFESPEVGAEHDYFHCQPCRNFGNKENIEGAALISQRFPTIPLNAANIVELSLCTLMAAFGRKRMKSFVRSLLTDSAGSSNEALKAAYSRCCKDSYVEFKQVS